MAEASGCPYAAGGRAGEECIGFSPHTVARTASRAARPASANVVICSRTRSNAALAHGDRRRQVRRVVPVKPPVHVPERDHPHPLRGGERRRSQRLGCRPAGLPFRRRCPDPFESGLGHRIELLVGRSPVLWYLDLLTQCGPDRLVGRVDGVPVTDAFEGCVRDLADPLRLGGVGGDVADPADLLHPGVRCVAGHHLRCPLAGIADQVTRGARIGDHASTLSAGLRGAGAEP